MHHQLPSSPGGHAMPGADAGTTRALAVSGWLTGIYFGIELGIGIWTGSIALISDAFHTFSAVGGVLIALVAGRMAARPATRFQTFGSLRAEIVGAQANGFFLLRMAWLVFWMSLMRLQNPVDLPTTPMLLAAGGAPITELISLNLLYKAQKTNLNIKGAYWHILQTFAGSLIIIVAALTIWFTDFLEIDPLLGMAFGLLLLQASWTIIRAALYILLNNVPRDLDLNEVQSAVEAIHGVDSVHHLHAWSITEGKNIMSAHVLVSNFGEAEHTLQSIQAMLKSDFQMYFSTIQLGTEVCPETEEAEKIDFLRQQPD